MKIPRLLLNVRDIFELSPLMILFRLFQNSQCRHHNAQMNKKDVSVETVEDISQTSWCGMTHTLVAILDIASMFFHFILLAMVSLLLFLRQESNEFIPR